VIKISPLNLWG